MNFGNFEKQFLWELKNNNNHCLKTLENNEKLILDKLKDCEKPIILKEFVNKLNNDILNVINFDLYEKVLNHRLFIDVLNEFKNSDVLIRACKNENIEAANWISTMNVSGYVQDEYGRTALMYAVKSPKLDSVVDNILASGNSGLHLTDCNNETVLFHAVTNDSSLKKLLSLSDTSKLDFNHKNNNGETVLIYCCKYDIFKPINKLISKNVVDLTLRDNDDRNAIMYLVDNARYFQLIFLNKNKYRFDCNFRNKFNETLVTHLIQQFRNIYTSNTRDKILIKRVKLICLAHSLMALVDLGCDFNIAIDDDGNTPLMFFLMMGDYYSVYYLLKNNKNLNLSLKNRYGQSATTLSLNITEPKNYLRRLFMDYKTYDYNYMDEHQNHLFNYFLVKCTNNDIIYLMTKLKEKMAYDEKLKEKVYTNINDKNENPIIIAVKTGHSKILSSEFFTEKSVNQQDHLGNNALFYAIKIKDKYAINLLRFYHADLHLKNNQGATPFDIAKQLNDESILEAIKMEPICPELFNENQNKENEGSKKKFSIMNSIKGKNKKTKDDKINDYIQNYQIKNYQAEYTDILEKIVTDNKCSLMNIYYVKNNIWAIYTNQQEFGSTDISFVNYISLKNETKELEDIIRRKINDNQLGTKRQTMRYMECPF